MLVGHSNGGCARPFASLYPNDVVGLVIDVVAGIGAVAVFLVGAITAALAIAQAGVPA